MGFRFGFGWADYVPVAERRKKAEREITRLRKQGHPIAPVSIEGRTIARTFWGKAWCANLESYRDYENRLPRGRSCVRNGLVLDLRILPQKIEAMVSGSSIYDVGITVGALPPSQWRSICKACAGGIDSLVELLQGRFSEAVMERICRQDGGLFPKPSEIGFSCSCPDGASMCKHVAAALYGVGARLDAESELLFRLRAVDANDLVAGLDEALPLADRLVDGGKVLATDDVSALFGLDFDASAEPAASEAAVPAAPEAAVPAVSAAEDQTDPKRAGTKQPRRKTTTASRSAAAADAKADKDIAQPSKASSSAPEDRAPKPRRSGKASISGEATPANHADRPAIPKRSKSAAKRKVPKPEIDLTPDGYVKWWK
jgi:uncharacterized Zn finger protein